MVDVSKGVAFGQRLLFCRYERKGGENMAEPGALDYFYGTEAEQYTFYRIPKVLFTDPGFRRITADAKILYGLMLDRMGLSISCWQPLQSWGLYFKIRFPASTPLICWWGRWRLCCCVW